MDHNNKLWYLFDSYGHVGVYQYFPLLQDAEVILLVAPLDKICEKLLEIQPNYDGCPKCDRHIKEILSFYKASVIEEIINEEN